MPTYIGFSTNNVCQRRTISRPGADGGIGTITNPPKIGKKFKLTDTQLVLRDLLNAFSINQGDKVGQPGYGSPIRNFVFEPNTTETRQALETAIRKVVANDPRIILNTIDVYSKENGILVELEIAVNPFNDVVQVGYFMNRFDGSIQQTGQ